MNKELPEEIMHTVDEKLSRVRDVLEAEGEQMLANRGLLLGDRRSLPRLVDRDTTLPGPKGLLGFRVSTCIDCLPGCYCRCHIVTKTASQGVVDHVLGQLFIGYAGLPIVSPSCDVHTCRKAQSALLSVEYWFPLRFVWSQIIRLQVSCRPNLGPQFGLSTLRRVPDSAQCVSYALSGNIDGLKDLFARGLASPRDVSSTRGYSVLRVSTQRLRYESSLLVPLKLHFSIAPPRFRETITLPPQAGADVH